MSKTNASACFTRKYSILVVPLGLGLVLACAGVKPSGSDEEPTATAEEALTTSYTATFQDGTNGYAGTLDTYLNQSAATTNYGNVTTLYVDGDDPTRTGRDLLALLRFDVSSIPVNATVTGATLTLYVSDATVSGYPIYGLNRTWNETQATWTRAASGTNWEIAGAMGSLDRDSALLGTFAAASTGSKSTSLNATGLAELQSWVTTPDSNFGLFIASSSLTDKFAFYSSEHWTVSRRPKLVVSYTLTTPDCIAPACCTTDAACSDGNACTADACVSGACSYSTVAGCCNSASDCADDGNLCTTNTCIANVCRYPVIAGCCLTTSECDDGNSCTSDVCFANACSHAAVSGCCNDSNDCNDGNACTADTCSANVCSNPPLAGCCLLDSECSDGNLCTVDTCTGNVCAFPAIAGCCLSDSDCADASICTLDACVQNQCSHTSLAGCCSDSVDCSDGNACTTDTCDSGTCSYSAVGDCCNSASDCADDGNPCTTNTCSANVCSYPALAGCCLTDSDCNDGDACSADTCTEHVCSNSTIAGCGGPKYGFFVYSDSHIDAASNTVFSTALTQMEEIKNAAGAPPIIAAMSVGDHTESGLTDSWDWHMGLTGAHWDAAATSFGGALPRYIALPGNHDVLSGASWYSYWSAHLPGLASLGGSSSSAGVYYSFTYENALFVGLDTNMSTNTSTSYQADPQIGLLRSALSGSVAPFKFVFYHRPAFYCGFGGLGPNPSAVAFVDLAAQNNVDVVFNGHSHVFARTCRMTKNHVCTGTTSGTVQVEVGTVGATDARLRFLNTAAQSVTGYDASGVNATLRYTCTNAGGYAATLGSQRTFCYVHVQGCSATVSCYEVGVAEPFDTWTLDHCP